MAHITFARVSGLAGRKKDVELKFDRHVNVFFGVNGVGKTTLLKILHSAFLGDSSITAGLPFTSAEVGIHSIDAGREIIREIRNEPAHFPDPDMAMEFNEISEDGMLVLRHERPKKSGNSWRIKNKRSEDSEDLRLAHEYLPTTRLFSASDFVSNRRTIGLGQSDEESINSMMETQLKQQWIKYFAPLQSAIQDAQQKGMARILSAVLSDASSQTDVDLEPEVAYAMTRHFLSSHSSSKIPGTKSSFISRYRKDKNLAALVNEIAIIEKEVKDLQRPKDQLEELLNNLFLRKHVDLSGGSIRVAVRSTNDKMSELRLSQLSSGEKQALYILIHALRAKENSLVIDEPELSMHIDWQRQLIDSVLMLNPKTQLVMATHSPEVMATIADTCIFEI